MYTAMCRDAFHFFQATPTLFYQDNDFQTTHATSPLVWLCGDLHLENVTAYLAEDGYTSLDINDFSEALLAPCAVDILRLLTSLFVAAPLLDFSADVTHQLAMYFIASYGHTLREGSPRQVNLFQARGPLQIKLDKMARRSRREWVARFTRQHKSERYLYLDQVHLFPLADTERDALWQWLSLNLAAQGGYTLRDVAWWQPGPGKLARNCFAVLAETSLGQLELLELQEALPPVGAPTIKLRQPDWTNPATRVVRLHQMLQAHASPPLWIQPGPANDWYIGRLLQPPDKGIRLGAPYIHSEKQMHQFLGLLGQLTASAHLRGSGQPGTAAVEELKVFGADIPQLTDYVSKAAAYALQVRDDYHQFASDCQAGWPGV